MFTKIQKWGNSQGLRFPKFLLEEANIKVGDDVNISVKKGKIIIEPKANIRKNTCTLIWMSISDHFLLIVKLFIQPLLSKIDRI